MAARYLLNLHRFADTAPSEIRTRDAALFTEMQTRVLGRARAYLRTSFPRMSPALRDHLTNADLPLSDWPRGRNPREVILQTLDGRRVPPEVRAEAVRVLTELEDAGMLPAGADMARAIRQLPFFEQELRQARVAVVADAAGLPEQTSEELLKQVDSLSAVNEDRIGALVRRGVLQEEEARRLTLSTNLYRVAGAQLPLMTALASESFAALGGRQVNHIRDLARLTAADWERVITRAGIRLEAGTDARATAVNFERTMAAMFPTDALFARVVTGNVSAVVSPALDRLAPVLSSTIFDRAFDDLPVEGLTPAQITAAREAHAELRRLVNLHPGLRLGEVLGSSIPAAQKVRTVESRLGLLEKVSGLNPDLELLTLDYRPDSADMVALKLDGLAADEQQMVLGELKSHQRAFGITNDPLDAVTLLGAGYSSARAAATVPFEEFRANTGLPDMTAKKYHQEATQLLGDAALTMTTVVDAISGGFDKIGLAGNIELRPMYAHLNKLQGFADLFGNQDYCACEHCQSIFGPAAYFVDLMLFAEEQALKIFTGAKKTHALNLKVRRPDLWKLELTCDNTNTLIPTLDIINEILENAIAVKRNFAGDFADRAAVEEEVYRQAISNAIDSFRQPFTLPLEKLAIYLTHFDRSRADVAAALAAPDAILASAVLGLSEREYELVTQPNVAVPFLRGVYGIQFTVGANGVVAPVDVQQMLKFTGLSRKDFGSLVATRYVTAGGADPVEIKAEKKTADSLQNDVEHIRNLTPAALDRLHRLTRLWRHLGWNVAEVDLALTHLSAANMAVDIGTTALDHLATVVLLRARWSNVPVEQALALWSSIPATPVVEGRKSLLDRLFNVAPFVTADGPLPNAAVSFVHSSLRESGAPLPSDNTLNRLLAGLQLSEDHLGQLITRLAGPLGANVAAANENDRGFALSLANLTLLYRHARLTQLLRLSVADLFQLIVLAGIGPGHIAAIADLSRLLEFHRWWKGSGFKLDDLGFVTKGLVQLAGQYPDPVSIAAQIVVDLISERSLQFADTVFAFVPGVTEGQSRQLVAANLAAIEPTMDGSAYRLRGSFNPQAPLTIPPGITVTEADARAALLQHHASVLVPLRLGSRFGLALDKTTELVAMTGADLSSAPVVDAVWNGPIAPLVTIVEGAAPLAVLFRHAIFDAAALQFVRAQAALFDLTDFNAIAMTAVRRLSTYAYWTDPAKVAADAPEGTKADPAAVRSVLLSFDPVTKFGPAAQPDLAKALRVDPVLLASLLPNLTLPSSAVDALDMVGRAAALAATLGVGGEALKMMISTAYADLARASDAVLSSLRARYPEEKDFADRMEPLLDRLRSRRRDALADYLIRSAHPQFHSLNELYAYYLVDVQLEGCARTSRLVCATSSVQLYINRCILDLEQDNLPPNSANHVHVKIPAEAIDEWTWRRNYRVWEANRKVLLYPETYIEPELRDDKTPLFKELEGTLLQQRINEQNVLDAYATYLAGLEEVTRLKIAGTYHDIGAERDRLHLFGVLPGDPPLYYYRTVENAYHGETGEHRTPVLHAVARRSTCRFPCARCRPSSTWGGCSCSGSKLPPPRRTRWPAADRTSSATSTSSP